MTRRYLGKDTRIEYGFHIKELGKSYQLQERVKFLWVFHRWRRLSWTYGMFETTFEGLRDYLLSGGSGGPLRKMKSANLLSQKQTF